MQNVYFTSDTHFNHTNIAGPSCSKWKGGYRNFKSVHDMNETIIANWNKTINQHDIVYHLGDFAITSNENTIKFIRRLNGQIHLIYGNHDKSSKAVANHFTHTCDVKEINVEDQKIFLSHYAHRTWAKAHHGVWHLYGHSHGSLPDDPHSLSFDVGVDCHNFTPISFQQVCRIMSKKAFKPIDHHE